MAQEIIPEYDWVVISSPILPAFITRVVTGHGAQVLNKLLRFRRAPCNRLLLGARLESNATAHVVVYGAWRMGSHLGYVVS